VNKMANYGENLKKIRKARGLTQINLSELSEVSQSTICEIEKNAYLPKISVTIKLANALNISVMDLDEELEKNVRNSGARLVSQDVTPYVVSTNSFESIKLMKFSQGFKVQIPLNDYVAKESNQIIYLPDVKEGDFVVKLCDNSVCGCYPEGTFLHCSDSFPEHGRLVVVHMRNGDIKIRIYAINNQKQYLMAISPNDSEDFQTSDEVLKIWTVVRSLKNELNVAPESNGLHHNWKDRLV
jgi:transcriptional regulator with XRE-family HTH domain